MMVWPSAVARTTRPVAMLPAAPVTFSMTTGCPSVSRMRSARMRANTSAGPAAGNGTTRVIGRDG